MNEVKNVSGLRPVGRAILIAPYAPERKASAIVIPEAFQAKANMVEQRAVVIEVGPCAWYNEPLPRAKVGDKVLVSKFAGYMAEGTLDKLPYRFVNDSDIFALIEAEEV